MSFSLRLHNQFWPAILGCLCCVLILALDGSVLAQPAAQGKATKPSPEERARAQKFGRERSAPGLETIIATGNVDLIGEYERGFRETSMRAYMDIHKASPLPPEIEAVITSPPA